MTGWIYPLAEQRHAGALVRRRASTTTRSSRPRRRRRRTTGSTTTTGPRRRRHRALERPEHRGRHRRLQRRDAARLPHDVTRSACRTGTTRRSPTRSQPVAHQCFELKGKFESTSLAPSGKALAYSTAEGVYVAPIADDCALTPARCSPRARPRPTGAPPTSRPPTAAPTTSGSSSTPHHGPAQRQADAQARQAATASPPR